VEIADPNPRWAAPHAAASDGQGPGSAEKNTAQVRTNGQEERRVETTNRAVAFSKGEEPKMHGGDVDRRGAAAVLRAPLTWHRAIWWAFALLAASAAVLLLHACPVFAQAGGDIDTCGSGSGVGGEGGQKIINGIKNIALFGAAMIASLSVLGLIASAAMVIIGSTSKDWQRRGFTGLALCGVGIFVALGAAGIYSVINWAICG
jgi:hypothetical protein